MYDISGFPLFAYGTGYDIIATLGIVLAIGMVVGSGDVRASAEDGRELAPG